MVPRAVGVDGRVGPEWIAEMKRELGTYEYPPGRRDGREGELETHPREPPRHGGRRDRRSRRRASCTAKKYEAAGCDLLLCLVNPTTSRTRRSCRRSSSWASTSSPSSPTDALRVLASPIGVQHRYGRQDLGWSRRRCHRAEAVGDHRQHRVLADDERDLDELAGGVVRGERVPRGLTDLAVVVELVGRAAAARPRARPTRRRGRP